jgi:fatty acid desaturase
MVTASSAQTNSPERIFSPEDLKHLNQRSNWKGTVQTLGHLAILAVSGGLWATQRQLWWVAIPALVVYGFSLATAFAPVHEGVHRSVFTNKRLNDALAWGAGLLSFYNSTFFRRYHKWHHRYTQVEGKDPELEDATPSNLGEYLWHVSAIPWWIGKLRGHVKVATGRIEDIPYIPAEARGEVIRSTRLQLLVYAAAIALSIGLGQPWFLLYWLLPLALGQPLLRLILLAEHTHCTPKDDPLTNTRTTHTLWPIRFLMWNMPFHAEHHLYPSIPFHALPAAHSILAPHLSHVAQGYSRVNRDIIAALGSTP